MSMANNSYSIAVFAIDYGLWAIDYLFPFDRCGRLGTYVVNYTVDALDFINHAVGDLFEQLIGYLAQSAVIPSTLVTQRKATTFS